MSELNDPFFPQNVDESIEQLVAISQSESASGGETKRNPNVHLISDLQKFYNPERDKYLQALQRVEGRLLEQILQDKRPPLVPSLQKRPLLGIWKARQGNLKTMEIKQSSVSGFAKFGRNLSLVAILLILVSSVVVVLNYAHLIGSTGNAQQSIPVSPTKKPTPTPIPRVPLGTTLYTTPVSTNGFTGFSWSPDSKRVVSTNGTDIQIWDATTGKYRITITMPGGTGEWPYDVNWSPTNQLIAVGTNQNVLLVNSQTGQIVRTYSSGASAQGSTNTNIPSHTPYLSSQFPASGGFGYRATSWSPNGHSLASTISFGQYGAIQVWNPQTATLNFTLNIDNNTSYAFGSVAWSSDGQYIAATAWNTQGGDPTQLNNLVIVWNVSTHHIVFQHRDMLDGSNAPVIWQPKSHNITFGGTIISGGNMTIKLEIWNAISGKLVKQYDQGGAGGIAWSPDGKFLAYTGYIQKASINAVIIMDIATGKQIYAYKNDKGYDTSNITIIAWSPDGKYIFSDEQKIQMSVPQEKVIGRVWVAE